MPGSVRILDSGDNLRSERGTANGLSKSVIIALGVSNLKAAIEAFSTLLLSDFFGSSQWAGDLAIST